MGSASRRPAGVARAAATRLSSICKMRCRWPFTRPVSRLWCRKGRRGQRLVDAPGENRKVYGFGLLDWRDGWFDGRVAPGRTADVFCEQVRAAVARSRATGTCCHRGCRQSQDPHGGWFPARAQLAEPSSRTSCTWCIRPPMIQMPTALNGGARVSRRAVTHNHHRCTFELLLADVEQHFETRTRTPAEVLRHIGSPFAPDKDQDAPLSLALAA